MAEVESRKKNISKEFIKEKVLNKELVEAQGSFLSELNSFKQEIDSLKNLDILGSEKATSSSETQTQQENIIGMDNIMKLLFNNKGKQRTKIGYETNKMVNLTYLMISDEGKRNLDLLYESLQKSKTEQELRESLGNELTQLQTDVLGNQGNNNTSESSNTGEILGDLTSSEKSEMQKLVEESKTSNSINYLENATYKKYLNMIECDLNLPKYTLECVCYQESGGKLYNSGGSIIGSSAGAQGLFQFMPDTANSYMKNNKLGEKYGKTFTSKDNFLKDPLASAWAAGIMYSEFMQKYNYNLQTSLACYNWGIGNYQNNIGNKNITPGDLSKLPDETRKYVENITKDLLKHNSISSDNIFADLGNYKWNAGNLSTEISNGNNILMEGSPELLAKKNTELGGLGNSMMTGFQGYYDKTKFPNMDGVESKNTKTHPRRFNSKQDVVDYKNNHTEVKSFMFYFGANTRDNNQTLSDIRQWSEWMQEVGIQPVLCTCIGEDNHSRLTELNEKIKQMGTEKSWPVLDFAKEYNNGQIAMGDNKHPTGVGYNAMSDMISECLV